ncbi:hypothetical protein GUJ93_ZPchr0001g31277 [Zizania palustris]|uniref:Uncharacterized protein n=1 Tax=Zizania palustris TaxID=103762 RepID=A0A8J5RR45_ZIZPA|nr:hypothetical protein GUJ93_ZPchr0001g31277 [Zizania palustris]
MSYSTHHSPIASSRPCAMSISRSSSAVSAYVSDTVRIRLSRRREAEELNEWLWEEEMSWTPQASSGLAITTAATPPPPCRTTPKAATTRSLGRAKNPHPANVATKAAADLGVDGASAGQKEQHRKGWGCAEEGGRRHRRLLAATSAKGEGTSSQCARW